MDREKLRNLPPREVRQLIREGKWRGVTAFVSAGYAQANLAILPKNLAFEFLLFCQRNPKPCPVLEVTEPGNPILSQIAKGANIRTDIPKSWKVKEWIDTGERSHVVAGEALPDG